jgi:lysophospholipase L1-like esterase
MKILPLFPQLFNVLKLIVKVILMTLVMILMVNYLLLGLDLVKDVVTRQPNKFLVRGGETRAALPAYDLYPDKVEFWKEYSAIKSEHHFEPYFHWRPDPFDGKYIHIDSDGVRRTVKGNIPSGAKKVFMFGGSTMFGEGVKDQDTIPSYLQEFLGDGYDVYNYGAIAYVAAQELNYLLYQLSFGNIPDIVVFYDGNNDTFAGAYSPAIPRDPQNLRFEENSRFAWLAAWYNQSYYERLVKYIRKKIVGKTQESWDDRVKPGIEKNVQKTIAVYEEHIRQVQALAKVYGFEAHFFWQPNIFGGDKILLAHEEPFVKHASPVLVSAFETTYAKAKDQFAGREREKIFFLGDIFADEKTPVYIDWCHLGPQGNALIAKEIYYRIKNSAY